MKLIEIAVNCPSPEIAQQIADALIERRLIACANIHAPIDSTYRWKGAVEREREVPLVAKTREELFDRVSDEVRTLHPYETPSIIGIAVDRVNPEYLEWIYEETVDPAVA